MGILDIFKKSGKAVTSGAKKTGKAITKDMTDTLSVGQGVAGLIGSAVTPRNKTFQPKVHTQSASHASAFENSAKRNYAQEREYAQHMAERTSSTNRRAVQDAGGGNVLSALNNSSKAMDSGNNVKMQLLNQASNRLLQAQGQTAQMKGQVNQANMTAQNQANNIKTGYDYGNYTRNRNTDGKRMSSSINNLLLNKEMKKSKKGKDELDKIKGNK